MEHWMYEYEDGIHTIEVYANDPEHTSASMPAKISYNGVLYSRNNLLHTVIKVASHLEAFLQLVDYARNIHELYLPIKLGKYTADN